MVEILRRLRLLGLINDILDFSKIEAGKLELEAIDFSLRDCIAAHAQAARHPRRAKRARARRRHCSTSVPEHLVGDPLRLRQILINLVDNAIKFTERGSVVVKVERTRPARNGEQCLHFPSRTPASASRRKSRALIFEAFAQADGSTTRNYGGTGLGLAIASQLVEQMRGKIWIESTSGKGRRSISPRGSAWSATAPPRSRSRRP